MRKPRKGDLWKDKENGMVFYIMDTTKDKYHVMTMVKAYVGNHFQYKDVYLSKNKRYGFFYPFEEACEFLGRAKGRPEDIFTVK